MTGAHHIRKKYRLYTQITGGTYMYVCVFVHVWYSTLTAHLVAGDLSPEKKAKRRRPGACSGSRSG